MRPPPANEDLAIVSFDPLPGNVLNFGAVRNIIREFLISRHINPKDILPCHLGQASVRFNHAYERDQMVNESPMVFGNVNISFVKHNEGRNWRRVYFNDDCWVMMLGFPDDYKTERHIHNAVSDFGRLLLWEESNAFPGRIMARVKVTSAQGVTQFIVYSDSLNINGDSWTIQCEVVQRQDLGDEPPEEDPMPNELEKGKFVPFDFMGLGQPVVQQEQAPQQVPQQGNELNQLPQQGQNDQPGEQLMPLPDHQLGPQQQEQIQGQGQNDHLLGQPIQWEPQQLNPWDPWPAWPVQNPAQQLAQNVPDLNLAPFLQQQAQIHLNDPADPVKVIINPANPPNQDYIELNDLLEVIEENIPERVEMAD